VSTGVAIDKIALKIKMSAWVHGRGGMRIVCYRVVKDVFFSRENSGGMGSMRDTVSV